MKIDLVAIDIDGTLLTEERRIHPQNVAALREAAHAGVRIVLASGRIVPSIAPFAKELGLGPGPRVCCNGAHVVGPSGEDIARYGLDDIERDRIIEFAVRNKLHLNAYTPDQLLFTSDDSWGDLYLQRAKTMVPGHVTVEELRKIPVLKLMFVGEPERLRRVNREIVGLLDPRRVRITESEPEYLEFLSPTADKGRALERLCSYLGVPQDRVAAIGDYFNDLEMIQWAGVGCVVGNAPAAMKEAADMVAPSNEEGGVAWFVRHVLSSDRVDADSDSAKPIPSATRRR